MRRCPCTSFRTTDGRVRNVRGLSSDSTAYCFVTVMLFPLVVSVNPAVCFVNDPLSEPAVTAVYFAPDAGGCLGLNVTLRAPDSVAFEITVSVEAKYSVSAAPAAWL